MNSFTFIFYSGKKYRDYKIIFFKILLCVLNELKSITLMTVSNDYFSRFHSFSFGRKWMAEFNPDKLLVRMRHVRKKLFDTTF